MNRRDFSIFLLDLVKDYKKSKQNQRKNLPLTFAVSVVLHLLLARFIDILVVVFN